MVDSSAVSQSNSLNDGNITITTVLSNKIRQIHKIKIILAVMLCGCETWLLTLSNSG